MESTIVMTGASRGIGLVAAEHIRRETRLVAVTRGPGEVSADLGSLESIRSAAAGIRDRLDRGELPPLRGFVGNAGIQHINAWTESADGFEATFAINVLANYLFIRLLADRFVTPARIVITVSDTHFGDFRHNLGMVPGPVWKSPQMVALPGAFANPGSVAAGRTAYSTSKLAAIYLVHECARRLPGIDVVAYNPAFVPGTGLGRNASGVARFALRRILPLLTVPPFATSRRAAGRFLADVVLGRTAAPTGSYVDRGRVVRSSAESYDPEREAELWAAAERFTAC